MPEMLTCFRVLESEELPCSLTAHMRKQAQRGDARAGHTGVQQWRLGLDSLTRSTSDLSLPCCTAILPTGPLCPETSGPALQTGQEGPGFLTPAAFDGEAEETQLASVAGSALNARAAGALPSLGVALVLLGAQWVALTAVAGEDLV